MLNVTKCLFQKNCMSKRKFISFKTIHTIIDFRRSLQTLVVLHFHSDGNCMNFCQYSVLAFAFPKSNLCLGCDQIMCCIASLSKQLLHYQRYYSCKHFLCPRPPANNVFLVCECTDRPIKSIITVSSECIIVYYWCRSV